MAAASSSCRANVEAVRACLHKKLRVELTDGRAMEGILDCYDDSGNMILTCTTDVTSKRDQPSGLPYRIGTVLVPGHAQVSVKVWRTPPSSQTVDERTALLKLQDLRNALDKEIVTENADGVDGPEMGNLSEVNKGGVSGEDVGT